MLADVVETTGSAVLGLTLACCRCHDHKYDPIPQKDFYRFQAFFNATQVENVEVPYKDEAFKQRADTKIKELQALLKDGPDKLALEKMERDLLPKFRTAKREAAAKRSIAIEDQIGRAHV